MILVPSIPHTGSELVANVILKDYEHTALRNWRHGEKSYFHIYYYNLDLCKEAMKEVPAIIPLRHPILTAVSWYRRKKDLGELCVLWYILVEQLDRYNPFYLPVDHKDRNEYLDRINKTLNLKLSTDWPIINSVHNTFDASLEELPDGARYQIERLCRNIKEFIDRFYG